MCLAAFQVESQRNYARTALGCWSDVPNMSGCIDTDVKIEEYVHTYKYIYMCIYIVNGSTSAMMIAPKTMKERRYQSLSNRPRSRTANCLFQAELQGRSRHGKCPKMDQAGRQKVGLLKANGYGYPDPICGPGHSNQMAKDVLRSTALPLPGLA